MQDAPDLTTRLAMALDAHAKAMADPTPRREGDNPLDTADLAQMLRGAGIRVARDMMPTRAKKYPTSVTPVPALDKAAIATVNAQRADRSAKRKAVARARAQRKAQFDEIAASPVQVDPVRMTAAWLVVQTMHHIVIRIGDSKAAWARRHLGSVADDVTMNALESIVHIVAKQDRFEMPVLMAAAEQLAGDRKRIPGDQAVTDDMKAERKTQAQARKWLMGVTNNRVISALVDAYRAAHNVRWENLDIIETILASIGGAGEDPMMARCKADAAPRFLARGFGQPGRVDPAMLAMAIAGAITERGLDALAELLLNEDAVRTDGAFMWTENAEAVFNALGEPWVWKAVVKHTAGTPDFRRKRGDAARLFARKAFAWLPGTVQAILDAFEQRGVAWVTAGGMEVLVGDEWVTDARAVMQAPFEAPHPVAHLAMRFEVDDLAKMARTLGESLACEASLDAAHA